MNDIPLIVELGERSYPIHFGVRALDELVGLVEACCTTRRAFVVTDTHVDALHGAPLRAALLGRGLDVAWCVVPAGEASKSLHEVQALYDRAFGFGVDRGTVVVAFGGGVVGDLAGFVAGTLLRGLPWVQVPTTVLSQTDSSVGGKTGVNHAAGKNLIGVFHQPALVFIDTAYLTTLPRRAIAAGLVETVKHGALVKPELVDRIRLNAPALLQPDLEALAALLRISVAVKAAIVSIDEREFTVGSTWATHSGTRSRPRRATACWSTGRRSRWASTSLWDSVSASSVYRPRRRSGCAARSGRSECRWTIDRGSARGCESGSGPTKKYGEASFGSSCFGGSVNRSFCPWGES